MTVRLKSLRRSPLWYNTDFLVFWGGQSLSQIGSRITREGLPLAAVITLGASPMMLGWLEVFSALPLIFLGLLVGVMMDRFLRRPFLIATDLLRFLVLLTIPLAALTGWLHMWVLFVTSTIMAVLDLIFTAAYESYVPGLAGRQLLLDANTKLNITESFAEIVGPGLAGALVQLITAPMAVFIDAFTYVISALSIWAIRKPEPAHANQAEPLRLQRDIREGWHAIWSSRVLLPLTLTAATSSIFGGIVFTMDVLFAIRTLHLGPFLFGFTVTFGGLGAIFGSALAQPLVHRFGYGPLLILSAVLDGVFSWLIPLAHGPVWLATLFLIGAQLLGDLFGVTYGVLESTLRQAISRDEVLGRVNTTVNLLAGVLSPAGALLGAWIAGAFSLRAAMAVGAAGTTLSALWLVRGSIFRLGQLQPEGEDLPH